MQQGRVPWKCSAGRQRYGRGSRIWCDAYFRRRSGGLFRSPCRRILIAPDAWEGRFTSADAVRHMLRSAAKILPKAKLSTQLIADAGAARWMRSSARSTAAISRQRSPTRPGKSVSCVTACCRTVRRIRIRASEQAGVGAGDDASAKSRIYALYHCGGKRVSSEQLPESVDATVLGRRIPASQRNSSQIDYRNGVETLLDICNFDFHLSKADWLSS